MNKLIWIFNHYAHPPNIPGGTRHYDLAKELVNRGYKITIFASSFIHGKGIEILNEDEKIREEEYEGINFVWIKTPHYKGNGINRIKNMLTYAYKIYFLTKQYEKPDVIIGSSVHPFTCLSAYYISKRYKCRYISEIRDLWPQTLVDMGAMKRNSIMAKTFYILEKFLYRRSDKIIVLLPGAIEYITNLGIDKDKIVYIPNGVDLKEFEKRKRKNKASDVIDLSKYNNKFKVLYAGAHGSANQLDTILQSAKLLYQRNSSDIQFVFIGDGPEKQRLIEWVEENDLNNIAFYPPVDKNKIPSVLSESDLLIVSMKDLPLYKYGISLNKLFDYFASGKPVVFSGKVSNDIVKDSNAGISVPPENPYEIVEAVLKLYNMSIEEREKLGTNGRQYVEANHDIPILVDKLVDIINDI